MSEPDKIRKLRGATAQGKRDFEMHMVRHGSAQAALPAWAISRRFACLDRAAALAVIAALSWMEIIAPMAAGAPGSGADARPESSGPAAGVTARSETLLAFYAGHPWYHRSDVRLTRPGGTDLELKDLGWDGDAFYPPIDGGVRAVRWWGNAGGMIDFLHNKAIARVGKGSHGRTISNPVIETVDAEGTIKGQPAPERITLTDLFTRLEFTHGHNTLMPTFLARGGGLGSGILGSVRPFAGVGGGIALPHTEVRFKGEPQRTSEYQYGGPCVQALAGLELRSGRLSYFLEYKFTLSWITGAITGEETTLEGWIMPGDLWRQARRWWRGEPPKYGQVETTLANHQVFLGVGYWVQR
jgi:hypothetical protein